MTTRDVQIKWDATPTDFGTLTNLHSLADGNIWQSGVIDDATPSDQVVRISYSLVFNATPVAGDSLIFRLGQGDEASSNEIWNGNIGTSESEISTAAAAAAVRTACPIVWEHYWITSQAVTFKGIFDVWNAGPSWQILVEANGEALTTGNLIRYRYGTPQGQTEA